MGRPIATQVMMRMRYRGKRFVVTMAPDGSWTWLILFSCCLSVKGCAITKFEAIDQATHIIDRMINFGTRRAMPSSRQGFARFVPGILPEKPATLISLLLFCRAPYLHPAADVRTRWFRVASRVLFHHRPRSRPTAAMARNTDGSDWPRI